MSQSQTDRLTRRLSWAALLSLAIGVLIAVALSTGARAPVGELGGDYPAFYTAGALVARGQSSEIYNWEAQRQFQAALHPVSGGFLPYVYPPFVAAAYAPLGMLPYKLSYLLHTLITGAAVCGAVGLLRGHLQLARPALVTLCAGAIFFYPMLRSVLGGQNTALSLLLLAGTWRLLGLNMDLWAGMCAGLLLFKPHFGLPVLALLALTGRWRVLAGAALSAAGLYLLGVLVGGFDWPMWWWQEGLAPYYRHDQSLNTSSNISLVGVAEAVGGSDNRVALWVGWCAAVLVAVLMAWRFWRRRSECNDYAGYAAGGIVLVAPHAVFYDAGLLIAGLAEMVEQRRWKLLGVLWLAATLQTWSESLWFSPLFPVVVGVWCWTWTRKARGRSDKPNGALAASSRRSD